MCLVFGRIWCVFGVFGVLGFGHFWRLACLVFGVTDVLGCLVFWDGWCFGAIGAWCFGCLVCLDVSVCLVFLVGGVLEASCRCFLGVFGVRGV